MRIKHTCFGWLDLDHVQCVTDIDYDREWFFTITLMFRDKPLYCFADWSREIDGPEKKALIEKHQQFLSQWKD